MASTEPRSGLEYGWDPDTEFFAPGMDANLLFIGRFGLHLSVKDRDLTAPPGSPALGDSYIVATGATGDWAGHDGEVAVYTGSGWAFGAPRVGWLALVEDESVLSAYKSGGWSAGVAI
jgi:hypothetical protein